MIFPVIFAALYAAHFALLRVPYYWDEAGYYIPAAWDFFRNGSLIPITTVSNAHPPLPSIYLALWWKASGFYPEVTREAVLMVAALALLGVWRLAMRLTSSPSVAFWTAALTGLYPIWFSQSMLAHADIFAAACSLWGLVYALPAHNRRPWVAAAWFSAAALSKETAIAIPLVLALIRVTDFLRDRSTGKTSALREAAWLMLPVLPLAGWYTFHYFKTGFLFGNAEFLRYNAQTTMGPVRVLAALWHRFLHLTAHMNLFVPVAVGLAALLLAPRRDSDGKERAGIDRYSLTRIYALLGANALLFSLIGGALLTRYLLPMYPLVILLALMSMYRRAPWWQGLAAVSAAAFVAALVVNPPYGFAPEDNLAWTRLVRMDLDGIHQLEKRDPGAVVLTAWPVSDQLTRPELGYVKEPWKVMVASDFTSAQIDAAAAHPEDYSAALVFSTKFDPAHPLFAVGLDQRLNEQYFGMHHDLEPAEIALRLHGTLLWKESNQGMWIALIRFNRQVEALGKPDSLAPIRDDSPAALVSLHELHPPEFKHPVTD
jgi:hypothetical protein